MQKELSMVTAIGASGLIRPSDALRSEAAKRGVAVKIAGETTGTTAPTTAVTELVAAGPPINADRVEALRQAIAEGKYIVDPKAIAARMIATDLPGAQ